MTDYWFYIPIPETFEARFADLPMTRQRSLLETAIHRALDEEGWPRGERGVMNVPAPYWYVVLFKHGELRGHVGPITGEDAALRAQRSWQQGGMRAKLRRQPLGPCLTNVGIKPRDAYYP